jgi:hypothetical protein
MERNLTTKRLSLEKKIPEIKSTISALDHLIAIQVLFFLLCFEFEKE